MPTSTTARRWRYPYEPQPKQALAHRLFAMHRLYGGGAGGGKTDWLLADVLRPILRYGVNGLLLRRELTHFKQPQGIIHRLLERIPQRGPHALGKWNANEYVWRFRNGAQLQLGYMKTDDDAERYVGGEVGVIGWDQVEQFTEWQYLRLLHPLRVSSEHPASQAGFKPYMVATANPGGRGHAWVKARWIDPAPFYTVWQPRGTEFEPEPGSRVFVQALLQDNKYLGEDYMRRLQGLPEDERRALLDGDWDVYAGARFGLLWKRDAHVIRPEDLPLTVGGDMPRGVGVDYGQTAPFAALWGAVMPDGLIVVYRELYTPNLTARQQGEQILAAEGPGERAVGRPVPVFLDPATWARDPHTPDLPGAQEQGLPPKGSIAWEYLQAGVPVQRANNDRLSGTALIADKLRIRPDGRPRLLIYNTCLNLIRTLPGIPRDEHNPELYDNAAESHAVDALRYLLMGLEHRSAARRQQGAARGRGSGSTVTGGLRRRQY